MTACTFRAQNTAINHKPHVQPRPPSAVTVRRCCTFGYFQAAAIPYSLSVNISLFPHFVRIYIQNPFTIVTKGFS